MLTGTLNKIRAEKAARIRDVEYIREMSREDAIDDRFMELEARNTIPSVNVFKEAAETADQIPADDSFKNEEINRILNSPNTLSLDEILGIED